MLRDTLADMERVARTRRAGLTPTV